MIDFKQIEKYRENNRIEAKKALGGLPHSIWETYSAFANTLGGIILLGVVELTDKSFKTVDLPDPKGLVDEFWMLLKSGKKVSVNILTKDDVQIHQVNGDKIISITIPRAQRQDKPVYIDGNPRTGSYHRSGEGDYRCSNEEVEQMFRDSNKKTPDMKVLDDMEITDLDVDCILRYRKMMREVRPEHIRENFECGEFLRMIGAAEYGKDAVLRPTAAGLLMFGTATAIVREFQDYRLDYREWRAGEDRPAVHIASGTGDWSGNIFDFYFEVSGKIVAGLTAESEDTENAVHQAVREALANSIINADYYGKKGIVIRKRESEIIISNPGSFRIEVEKAKKGGKSDPRNANLIKMFNLIGIGKRLGMGIPNIYSVWRSRGWEAPEIKEKFNPGRITVKLSFRRAGEKSKVNNDNLSSIQRAVVIDYITEYIEAGTKDIMELLSVSEHNAQTVLNALLDSEILVVEGSGEDRKYKLKS